MDNRLIQEPTSQIRNKFTSIISNDRIVSSLKRIFFSRPIRPNYTSKWFDDFAHRPSWCDAAFAMNQIQRGKANGNRASLYMRIFMQLLLKKIGKIVSSHIIETLIFATIIVTIFCFGLWNIDVEIDVENKWILQNDRYTQESNYRSFMQNHQFDHSYPRSSLSKLSPIDDSISLSNNRENSFDDNLQMIIQTVNDNTKHLLTKEPMLEHSRMLVDVANYQVQLFGENWTLSDICSKPPMPPLSNMMTLDDRLSPCLWMTPIDCFWDGAKSIGPFPTINISPLLTRIIHSLPRNNRINWMNLNPIEVIKDANHYHPMDSMSDLIDRMNIGNGYMRRQCIEPLDDDCPLSASNGYNICNVFAKLHQWNSTLSMDKKIYLKAENVPVYDESIEDQYFNDYDLTNESNSEYHQQQMDEFNCAKYSRSLRKWMRTNEKQWNKFLNISDRPIYPNFSETLNHGCSGIFKKFQNWPKNFVSSNLQHSSNSRIFAVDALQSTVSIASANDVYHRFKNYQSNNKPQLDMHHWNIDRANAVIDAWQSNLANRIDRDRLNHDPNRRQVYVLSSISDVFRKYSGQFKYDSTIIVGYLLLLLYAAFSTFRCNNNNKNSTALLTICGLILIIFVNLSAIGFCQIIGIKFNLVTIPLLPYISLLFGVQNLYQLLYNYRNIRHRCKSYEIAILLQECGVSISIVSIGKLFIFICTLILPIPALRSFCLQMLILLSFNFVAICVIFPSMMTIDLKIQKKTYRKDQLKMKGIGDRRYETEQYNSFEYLISKYFIPFIQNGTVKLFIIAQNVIILAVAIAAIRRLSIGSEIGEMLPKESAPAKFIQIRDKYFHFSSMFAVLAGKTIDYPMMQHKIDEYRNSFVKSHFIAHQVNGNNDWLSLMRQWLYSIQLQLDEALHNGYIDERTGQIINSSKLTDQAKIARRLVCSVGNVYNCSRVSHIRLVNSKMNDMIDKDGFYNYMTAWYNIDNIAYYLSQSAFYPLPPEWTFRDDEEVVVPPTNPLIYSRIHFYLINIDNDETKIQAITDIHRICDNFTTAEHLPNFPTGDLFTNWDQYRQLPVYLLLTIGVIMLITCAFISIILCNLWSGAVATALITINLIQLIGFMSIYDIRLNAMSIIAILISIVIDFDFIIHFLYTFRTLIGIDNQHRMISTIEQMLVPIIQGSFAMILSILALAFNQFDFVIKYFFILITVSIVIALFNCLTLQPVLMSLIGPSSEITPIDGHDKLIVMNEEMKKFKKIKTQPTLHIYATLELDSVQQQYKPLDLIQSDRYSLLSTINEEESGRESNSTIQIVNVHVTVSSITPPIKATNNDDNQQLPCTSRDLLLPTTLSTSQYSSSSSDSPFPLSSTSSSSIFSSSSSIYSD